MLKHTTGLLGAAKDVPAIGSKAANKEKYFNKLLQAVAGSIRIHGKT